MDHSYADHLIDSWHNSLTGRYNFVTSCQKNLHYIVCIRFLPGGCVLKVIAEDFIKPEFIETVLPLYRELISATKKEPHCIAYDFYIDEKDPGHFIFIEEWPNHAALDEHCASEHFRRLVPLIDQYTRQEARYILMDGVVNPTVTS